MKFYKHTLLVIVLLCLSLPVLQSNFNFVKLKPLDGDVHLAADTSVTGEIWFNSEYQSIKEKYLNDNFGFHNFYVRLRNQVCYTLFNKVFAKEVVAGKSGYLYEIKYLQTHDGLDYIGDDKVTSLFNKLKFVQDTLQKQGITFAILFAPGKATFYPEFIPSPFDNNCTTTNYLKFIKSAKEKGVNHIDFNNWFVQLKEKAKYPLYPQTGTHWSIYGMHVAFDTLAKYIEKASGKRLTKFDYSKVEMSDSLRHPDGDIAAGLNLLRELPHFTMAYPLVKWVDTNNVYKPKVLMVSDSYWMGVYFTGLPEKVFTGHEFWYYNQMLYNYNPEGKYGSPVDYDLKTSIEKNNFIFIMSTEASLKNLGWGIVDELYCMYKNGPYAYILSKRRRKETAEINKIRNLILNDDRWMGQIKNQARDLNLTVDSCVNSNASYYYWESHKNDPPVALTESEKFDERVLQIKIKMTGSKDWYKYLNWKAKKMKITLDSCINMDAIWSARNDIFNEKVEAYKKLIRETPKWLKDIEKKAKNWKISTDSCITIDARFMANEEINKKK